MAKSRVYLKVDKLTPEVMELIKKTNPELLQSNGKTKNWKLTEVDEVSNDGFYRQIDGTLYLAELNDHGREVDAKIVITATIPAKVKLAEVAE